MKNIKEKIAKIILLKLINPRNMLYKNIYKNFFYIMEENLI